MTVIAWDGETLAADSAAPSEGTVYLVRKVRRRADGALVAILGDRASALALAEWHEAGAHPDLVPAFHEDAGGFVLVTPSRRVFTCWSTMPGILDEHEEELGAWGSGRDAALAALFSGRNAQEAVGIACRVCIECRGPVMGERL